MLEDLDTAPEIVAATDALLRKADALYRFPTPVDDLVAAAGLSEPSDSILSDARLKLAPVHLLPLLRQVVGKVQGLLDRTTKEVHIRPDLDHDDHRRFLQVHEVSHEIFDWQSGLAYVDSPATLSPTTKKRFEREANQGASELLFQRDVFRSVAAEYDIGLGAVIDLHSKFGASIRSTLRRFAETHRDPVAAVVLDRQPVSTNPLVYHRHEAAASESWTDKFGKPAFWPAALSATDYDFIPLIASSSGRRSWAGQARLRSGGPELERIDVDVLDNGYNLLVLLWSPVRRRRLIQRKRVLSGSPG